MTQSRLVLQGNWSEPVSSGNDHDAYLKTLERFGCRCQYCGLETRSTPQSPLGYFDICVKDAALSNDPINWVPLCKICSDLNDLTKLYRKGTFIEAPWLSQGRLTNLLIIRYGVAFRPEEDWGSIKNACEQFGLAIDSTPREWDGVAWGGEPEKLLSLLDQLVHPLENQSYANKLRFRFNADAYEDAIRFWASGMAVKLQAITGESV
ncbi:hypothetical protein [Neptunomonas phycophila]|uniref:hypothetical protein n=1 Tax=Neptunomonas phycophila TaxID=1572645 RepID=UPI003514A3DA